MMNILASLLLQAAPANAVDVYAKLSLGDRVRVTFRHGASVTGTLVAPDPKVTRIDFRKEQSLTIDLSLEVPGLVGTMTVPKQQIGVLKKLDPMSPRDRAAFDQQKAIADAQRAQDERDRLANQPKPVVAPDPVPAPNPMPALTDEIKRGLELRKKFPPEKWTAETYEQIRLRKLRFQFITPEQREFYENYAAWAAAGEYESKVKPPAPEKR